MDVPPPTFAAAYGATILAAAGASSQIDRLEDECMYVYTYIYIYI